MVGKSLPGCEFPHRRTSQNFWQLLRTFIYFEFFGLCLRHKNQNLWCVILQKNILSGLITGRYQTFSLLFIGDWTIARGYADLYFVFSWQGPRQDCASNDSPIEDMLRIKNIALFQKVDQVIHSTKILLKSLAYSNLTCSLLPFFGFPSWRKVF